jgi:hypothetical protein
MHTTPKTPQSGNPPRYPPAPAPRSQTRARYHPICPASRSPHLPASRSPHRRRQGFHPAHQAMSSAGSAAGSGSRRSAIAPVAKSTWAITVVLDRYQTSALSPAAVIAGGYNAT